MYIPMKGQTSPPPYSPYNIQPSAPPNEMDSSAPMFPQHEIQVNNRIIMVTDDIRNGLICPHCQARVRMCAEHRATSCTYVWSALLCLFFCWPCVCLPCCCKCAYETNQFCPNCKGHLGKF